MTDNEIIVPARKESRLDQFMMQVLPEQDRQSLKEALPRHVPFERFERNLVNALMNEPKLMECNPREVFREVAKIAGLGLYIDPQLGEAYLITGWNGKAGRPTPQIRIGYRGMLKLVRQSGEIATLYAREVCGGDTFECREGTERYLRHSPDYLNPDRGEPIGFYAVAVFKDGTSDFEVMGIKEIHRIRERSDGWKAFKAEKIRSTPWSTDESQMACKTVLRRFMKRLPQSPDLARAFDIEDEADGLAEVSNPRTELPAKANIIGRLKAREMVEVDQTPHDEDTGEIVEHDSGQAEVANESPAETVQAEPVAQATQAAPQTETAVTAPAETTEAASDDKPKRWPTIYREQMEAATSVAEAERIVEGVKDKLDGSSARTRFRVQEIYDETMARLTSGKADESQEPKAQAAVGQAAHGSADDGQGSASYEAAEHQVEPVQTGDTSRDDQELHDQARPRSVERDDDPPRVLGVEVDEEGLPVGTWTSGIQKRRLRNIIKDFSEAKGRSDLIESADYYRASHSSDEEKAVVQVMFDARLVELGG